MGIRRTQVVESRPRTFAGSIHRRAQSGIVIKILNVYNVRPFYVLLSLIHPKRSCIHSSDAGDVACALNQNGVLYTHLMADDGRVATALTCHIDD